MKVEEITPLVTAQRKSEIERRREKADLAPKYGLWSLDSIHKFDLTKEAQERFLGIMTLDFALFDRQVVNISVTYEPDINKYPSWTIDEWTTKVSNTFGLPAMNNWELTRDKMGKTLKCKDLEIGTHVYYFQGTQLPGIGSYSYPKITIRDESYRHVIEQRAKSHQEKKLREFVF
jgi:hypothetical protein